MNQIKICFPKNEDLVFINEYYTSKFNKLVEYGILTKDQFENWIKNSEVLTKEEINLIFNTENRNIAKYRQIKDFGSDVLNSKFIEAKILEILLGYKLISANSVLTNGLEDNDVDFNYIRVANKRGMIIRNSCEMLLEKEKQYLMTYFCCYNADTNKRLWDSLDQFLEQPLSRELKTLNNIVADFIGGLDTVILRKIARHPLWRTRWISATKTSTSLFPGNVIDWDINKVMLCYWSNFYDSVYSGMERPEEFIINDDQLLDNWLETKYRDKSSYNDDPSKDTVRGVFKVKLNPINKNR